VSTDPDGRHPHWYFGHRASDFLLAVAASIAATALWTVLTRRPLPMLLAISGFVLLERIERRVRIPDAEAASSITVAAAGLGVAYLLVWAAAYLGVKSL